MLKRGEFVNRIAGSTAIVAAVPALLTSCEEVSMEPLAGSISVSGGKSSGNNDITVDFDDPNFVGLKDDGGFAYTGNIIVINTGNENFVALFKVCTHNGCAVSYNSGDNGLPFPCLGSLF